MVTGIFRVYSPYIFFHLIWNFSALKYFGEYCDLTFCLEQKSKFVATVSLEQIREFAVTLRAGLVRHAILL